MNGVMNGVMSGGEKAAEFAGSLRERIIVERRASGRDTLGAAAVETETIGTYWAAAEAMNTGEEERSESRSALPRWRFTLRNTDDILPGDIVKWDGAGARTLEMVIRSVAKEYRPLEKTILLAEEKI